MALIKRALLQTEEPSVHIIQPGEGTKVAGVQGASQRFIETLQPSSEYTYVLVNALGYSEFFGANSNTDYYGHNPHLNFNGLMHAWPDIGKDPAADAMRAKGWPYGYPCFYNAAVYAHHKNTDPQKLGFGDVIFAHANPHMKRIELVKRVFNAEAKAKGHTRILDKIRAGERTDVSMGCRVPFDLCSVCTDWEAVRFGMSKFDPKRHRHVMIAVLEHHRKVTPIRGLAVVQSDHCDCMANTRGRVLPDGQKVFVYNDAPRFFDISFVWVGADRTARVMWHLGGEAPAQQKVASAVKPPSYLEATGRIEIPDAVLEKTSSMSKVIPGGLATAVHRDADCSPDINHRVLERWVTPGTAQTVLSTLAGLGILLKPHEFQTVALGDSVEGLRLSDALRKRRVTFDTDTPGVDDALTVLPQGFSLRMAGTFAPRMGARSAFWPMLNERLTKLSSKKAPTPWHTDTSPMLDKLAQQYNGYRVSVLEQAEGVLPKVAHAMGEGSIKTSSLAPLVLAAGPMLHLLSAHFRKDRKETGSLNPVSNFVANNPTFSTLVTVGGLMRAAMSIKSGQAGSALKSVGKALLANSLISKATDFLT